MIRRFLIALGVALGALVLTVQPARAQAPDAQGWWWIGGTPVGLAPPYVPADGLYVANNPSGPEAVSAVRFVLAGGGGAGTLTLVLAGDARGTPMVGLCRLTTDWQPVQGGALSAAPACDVNGPTVQGTFASDGKSVSFPVGALARDGRLDVGIVPGRDASGASPTFQAAFAKPTDSALTAAASSGDVSGADGGAGAPSPTADTVPFTPTGSFQAPPATAFVPLGADAPLSNPATPAVRRGTVGQALPAATRSGSPGGDGRSAWRMVGFAVLAATALAYHRLSITPDRAPRSLVAFGRASEEES